MNMKNNGKWNDGFKTPPFLFDSLNRVLNFTLDAACESHNCLAPIGLKKDKGEDGLKSSRGHRVFCNHPFSNKIEWIKKASHEVDDNDCPIVGMILPSNSMSSSVWFSHIYGKYLFEILERRVAFLDENNKPSTANNSGTVIVYFKKKLLLS